MAAGRRSREEEEERKEDHLTVFPPAHLGCKLTLLEPPGALGNHLRVFLSLCSQLGPLLLQILICFQAMLGKHKWKNIIWEKSGILQKVTFLESALETDVPLKSICGQGLCWETNCYKGKSTELQHNGYKKKLRQEGEREEVGEGKEKKKKRLKKDILGVLQWQLYLQVSFQVRKGLYPAPIFSTNVLLDFDQTMQASA